MKVNLCDIDQKKPFTKHIRVDCRVRNTDDLQAVIRDLDMDLEICVDSQGYVARYAFAADVEMACVSCGETLNRHVAGRDWLALRTQQPEGSRIMLSPEDMNVRFMPQAELDLDQFVDEVVELELPSYPRHAGQEPCVTRSATTIVSQEKSAESVEKSPFSCLADLVDPLKK